MSVPDRVKLTVEVRLDQQLALRNLIPWGLQRAFFEVLVDDVIEVLKRHGPVVVAAVIDGKMRTGECSPIIRALMEMKGDV